MQLCNNMPDEIPFREIAKAFKIIDEPMRPILVPYGKEGKQVIEELKQCQFHTAHPGYVNRELRKQLQQYTVNVYERIFQEISGELFDVFGDGQFYVLLNMDIYDEAVGLKPENPVFMEIENTIF